MTRRTRTTAAAAALMLAFGFAARAHAQVFTGRIDVSVQDPTGVPLPGASVDLSGGVSLLRVSDARGEAHFLNLPVGSYAVKVSMSGFTPSSSSPIEVLSGESTPLVLRMAAAVPAAASEATTTAVTPSPPVNGPGHNATTTHVTAEDLQELPTPRDVWATLTTVPTVYADRVNVGGSESGRQATFIAKGAPPTDNTWNIDGVPVTDAGDRIVAPAQAAGASPFYDEVESAQEIAVTTGGADVRTQTPGVQLNMVLKTGINAPHGGARYYFENEQLQDVNISSALAATLGGTDGKGNRIHAGKDYGFDLGGPLLQDSVWIWGTMAWNTLDRLTLTGSPDNTSLKTYALKADGKLNEKVRGNFTFYENDKIEDGRGAGPLRPVETTWNQTGGPARYYKGEGSFIGGTRLFATARAAYVQSAFLLAPAGGLATDYYIDDGGVAHNTYYQYQSTRPQHYVGGDASYFIGAHELRFGGGWRSTPVQTQQTFPASHLVASWTTYPNMLVQVARDYQSNTEARYLNGFVSDTISLGRLTLTGGVRFDRQQSSLAPSSVPAVAGFETILPAVSAPAISDAFVWTSVTPRVAAKFAIGEDRKTILRGSYAMFASQLPAAQAAFVSPIQNAYAYYSAVDKNGDGIAQLSEVLTSQGPLSYTGFDPKNPLAAVNRVAADGKPPLTHEILAGFDQELPGQLTVSGTLTYRLVEDLSWTPLIGVTQANYSQTSNLTGTAAEIGAFSVPLYALSASAVPPGGGTIFTVRDGYHQRYLGFEVGVAKRLSKRWMARVGVSTNSWREYFDDPSKAILDPTRAPAGSATRPFAGPQADGGSVLQTSAGNGQSGIYMVAPAYQFAAGGVYEAIWGINVAANLLTRQGYAEPFFQSNVTNGDALGPKTVLLVPQVDAFRLPTVTVLDGRAEKKFSFGSMKLAIDFDVFNLLNAGTVLGKQYDARLTTFDNTLEIMSPRIARLGLRFTF